GEPCVLLVHQPAAFPTAAALGVPLTLAGHTHGGQVALPGLPAANPARLLMTQYDSGTFRSGHAVLHVNRGLGTSGQRVRGAVPREITVVTLVAAGDAAAAARRSPPRRRAPPHPPWADPAPSPGARCRRAPDAAGSRDPG